MVHLFASATLCVFKLLLIRLVESIALDDRVSKKAACTEEEQIQVEKSPSLDRDLPLQRIAFPPKKIVAVRSVAVAIVIAPDKGLRTISRPHGLVVERSCVPHRFVGNLWHSDGVGRRARTSVLEGSFDGAVHVILVVGTYFGKRVLSILARPSLRTVKVLPVPACWEVVNSH